MHGMRCLSAADTFCVCAYAGPILKSLALGLVLILGRHILQAWRSKLRLDLPRIPGPPGRALVGNLADILRPDFHKVMARWAVKYGEVYRINILGLDGVVVASPEAVSAVLGMGGHPGTEVPKHAQSYWALDLLWGSGDTHTVITGLNTDTWKTVHRAVAPCFNSAAVRCAPAPFHARGSSFRLAEARARRSSGTASRAGRSLSLCAARRRTWPHRCGPSAAALWMCRTRACASHWMSSSWYASPPHVPVQLRTAAKPDALKASVHW